MNATSQTEAARLTMGQGERGNARNKKVLRLWLRMLPAVGLVEQHLRSRFRDNFPITLPQFDVLAELERAGEPQTMSDLSRQLLVSSGNVTGLVDRLVRNGYVIRRRCPEDRRVLRVELSEKGRSEFATMAEAHERWLVALFDELGDGELDEINTLVARMKRALRNRLAESDVA